jgi:hypothetical protein
MSNAKAANRKVMPLFLWAKNWTGEKWAFLRKGGPSVFSLFFNVNSVN